MEGRDRETCSRTARGRRFARRLRRGEAAALLLLGSLLIMAAGAATASAAAPRLVQREAPGAIEPPAASQADITKMGGPSVVARGSSGGAGESTRAGYIFYDGFEGAAPPWTTQGSPTWAATTYRAWTGAWSAYCTGSAYPAPGPYANNMNAWLKTAGSLSLAGVPAATLSYKLYLKSEYNYDWLWTLVSVDGQNFYGSAVSGDSQGWIDQSMDLTAVPGLGNVCGYSRVWIAFNFTSDSSNVYEGAYVDDVSVVGGGNTAVMSLAATPGIVPFAGSVTLYGELRDATTSMLLPGREIEWWYSQSFDVPMRWTLGGTAGSGTGAYAFDLVNIQRRTYFITRFAGDAQYPDGCWSTEYVKIMALANLRPPAVPSRVRAGKLLQYWGTLKPQHTSAQNKSSHTKVYLERYSRGKYRPVASLFAHAYRNVSGATQYGYAVRYASGSWRVRAVHQDSDHAKTTSSWRYFAAY